MNTYSRVFQIKGRQYQVSDGLVLMLCQPCGNVIPLALYDIEDGTPLINTCIEIVPNKEMQFLELLVSQLLLKQDGHSLRVHDLLRQKFQLVKNTAKMKPYGFVFYEVPSKPYELCKVYHTNASRRFFTLSRACIDFWELLPTQMIKLKTIHVPGNYIRMHMKWDELGLYNPDLCGHSTLVNMFCVWAHDIFIEKTFTSSVAGFSTPTASQGRFSNYSPLKARKRDNSKRYLGDLEDSLKPLGSQRKVHNVNIFQNDAESGDFMDNCCYRDFKSFVILFFSLDSGCYLGKINSKVIGDDIQVLATTSDMSAIACGDGSGKVSIVANKHNLNNWE